MMKDNCPSEGLLEALQPRSPVAVNIRTEPHSVLTLYDAFSGKLPALAERLGVQDLAKENRAGRYMLGTREGQHYDFFELVNAFLDKLA